MKNVVIHNLRRLRKSRGLKQRIFADLLDLSETSYSRLETGKQKFYIEQILILADYFKIPPYHFFLSQEELALIERKNRVADLYNLAESHDRKIIDTVLEKYESRGSSISYEFKQDHLLKVAEGNDEKNP